MNGTCEPAVLLVGLIDPGSGERLVAEMKKFEGVRWVCLDSLGGSSKDAMKIGEEVMARGLRTCVVPVSTAAGALRPARCASACADQVFPSGRLRVLSTESFSGVESVIAFHMPRACSTGRLAQIDSYGQWAWLTAWAAAKGNAVAKLGAARASFGVKSARRSIADPMPPLYAPGAAELMRLSVVNRHYVDGAWFTEAGK
jgi:hypothetical protein